MFCAPGGAIKEESIIDRQCSKTGGLQDYSGLKGLFDVQGFSDCQ